MQTVGLSNSNPDNVTPNVVQLQQCISMMSEENRMLKEQLFLATRKQFSASSEAFSIDQLFLFSTTDTEVVTDDENLQRLLPHYWQPEGKQS